VSEADVWRRRVHRWSTRLYGPDPATTWLTWIADERIAIGALPTGSTILRLRAEGVTHVVNCRAGAEAFLSQELAVERTLFGAEHVWRAPMWDHGRRQPPRRWSAAAVCAARVLDEDATAHVLVHCKAGVHRSVMVAYAVLRLRGRPADDAAGLIARHRLEAELLPAYRVSVEDWIATGGAMPRPRGPRT
jgi:predicted protein tyrosine phosphatase